MYTKSSQSQFTLKETKYFIGWLKTGYIQLSNSSTRALYVVSKVVDEKFAFSNQWKCRQTKFVKILNENVDLQALEFLETS